MKDTDLDFIHRFVPPNSNAKEAKLTLLLLHGTGVMKMILYLWEKYWHQMLQS